MRPRVTAGPEQLDTGRARDHDLDAVRYYEAFVALLAGDPAGAEVWLRDGYRWLHESGERLCSRDRRDARPCLYAQGRLDEAFELTHEAEREVDADDLSPQFGWRAVRAAILARRGSLDEAKRLTAEALALVEKTDWLRDQADALTTQAEVLAACGERAAATEAMQGALALYEQKAPSWPLRMFEHCWHGPRSA